MRYVLGIDAGGTKTVCLLADEQGRVLGQARGGGANLQTAGELGVEIVLHGVMEEATAAHHAVPAAICLGMAGVDRPEDARVLAAIMRRIGYKSRVLIVNDALVALVAGAGDDPGVVVIAGTGSIAYGRNAANRAARAGGWGHAIGDEGSGFWIGREAVRAVMRQADRRGPVTGLTPPVLAHFGVADAPDLVHVIYDRHLRPQLFAALAPLVQEAAVDGDQAACRILREAGDELVAAAGSVAARLGLEQERFVWVLAGGMFRAVPWLGEELGRRLPVLAPHAMLRVLEEEPAAGAVRLALDEAGGGARVPEYL